MGWDFTIGGNTVLAVALSIFLKMRGFNPLLVTSERRLGNFSIQPFRLDHLKTIGVEPDRYSEAYYTTVSIEGYSEAHRLAHPVHICRTRDVLEQAVAVNEVEVMVNRMFSKSPGKVIDCRPPTEAGLKACVIGWRSVNGSKEPRISISAESGYNLSINIQLPTGSGLLIQYGQRFSIRPGAYLVQEHALTASSHLATASLGRRSQCNGFGLASPLGSSTADILIAKHLAASADDPDGHPPSLKAVLDSHLLIESMAGGLGQSPPSLDGLLKAMDGV
jgi:hypothetical protein